MAFKSNANELLGFGGKKAYRSMQAISASEAEFLIHSLAHQASIQLWLF